MPETTNTTNAARDAGQEQEIIPAIGSAIGRRKFVDGKEQVGEITEAQIVKGFTGVTMDGPHWTERCEPSPNGLAAPAIVCESGKTIPMDMYFYSWRAL